MRLNFITQDIEDDLIEMEDPDTDVHSAKLDETSYTPEAQDEFLAM